MTIIFAGQLGVEIAKYAEKLAIVKNAASVKDITGNPLLKSSLPSFANKKTLAVLRKDVIAKLISMRNTAINYTSLSTYLRNKLAKYDADNEKNEEIIPVEVKKIGKKTKKVEPKTKKTTVGIKKNKGKSIKPTIKPIMDKFKRYIEQVRLATTYEYLKNNFETFFPKQHDLITFEESKSVIPFDDALSMTYGDESTYVAIREVPGAKKWTDPYEVILTDFKEAIVYELLIKRNLAIGYDNMSKEEQEHIYDSDYVSGLLARLSGEYVHKIPGSLVDSGYFLDNKDKTKLDAYTREQGVYTVFTISYDSSIPNVDLSGKRAFERKIYDAIKSIANGKFPIYVRLVIVVEYDGSYGKINSEGVDKTIKTYFTKIQSLQEAWGYAEIMNRTYSASYTTTYIKSIELEYHKKHEYSYNFVKVAELNVENCVINIMRNYAEYTDKKNSNVNKSSRKRVRKTDMVDKIYNKFPELDPKNNQELINSGGYIYIDGKQLDAIAKLTGTKIITYSGLGSVENIPWQTYGYDNGKRIRVVIAQEHATIKPTSLYVNKIMYREKNFEVPKSTIVVDKGYYEGEKCGDDDYVTESPRGMSYTKFYTEINDTGRLTIHKSYNPRVTFPDVDPDDINYAYCFNDIQTIYKKFVIEHNLSKISDTKLRQIAKSSENFIGRQLFKILEPEVNYTEYDHNKNYTSYETLSEYIGFPTNDLIPVKTCPQNDIYKPAFVIIKNVKCEKPECEILYKAYGYFFNDRNVLTYPVYKYLVDQGLTIEVDYMLIAPYQHISVRGFVSKYLDEQDPDFKLAMNSIIGRTITGGIAELKKRTFWYKNNAERDQMIHECHTLDYTYNINESEKSISVAIKNKTEGLFNFHSFILGYASIHMMKKWQDLENSGKKIIGYNVDSFLVEGDSWFTEPENNIEPGKWKTKNICMHIKSSCKCKKFSCGICFPTSIYLKLNVHDEKPNNKKELPVIKLPEKQIPFKHTLYNAAAGIGKSHFVLTNAPYSMVMLTPTHKLKNEHKKHHPDTYTAHKYFQFTINDNEYEQRKRAGTLLPEFKYIVIDEASMFNSQEWEIIMKRKGNSVIIALGDFCQIRNEIRAKGVNRQSFIDMGFDIVDMKRTPDNKARHSYEYGCLLDEMRVMNIAQQQAYCESGIWKTVSMEDVERMMNSKTPEKFNIISGNHARTRIFNKMVTTPTILVKNRKGVFAEVDRNSKDIWWDRTSMNDVMPEGYKHEPAFAATVDSYQGTTCDYKLVIDIRNLSRHGAIYTAMTRCRLQENVLILI